jgi:SAM-dependent methyltransferase
LETLRRRNFATLCERLNERYGLEGKKILEVGCAEGWFLEEARRCRAIACAIEPSLPHAEMSRAKGFNVTDGFFPNDMSAAGKFDIIVFNDVFEHLPDSVGALERCNELLEPGGVLVLNVPSNLGVIYRLGNLLAKLGKPGTLERLWQKGFPSPHLSYYNPATLRRFVERYSALRHVDTFPLDTLIAEGLWERIEASHPGMAGKIIYAGLRLALPMFRQLPADIVVGIFEKPSNREAA